MPICLVDDASDMPSSIYESIMEITRLSGVLLGNEMAIYIKWLLINLSGNKQSTITRQS